MAVAVEGGQEGLDDAANEAEQAVDDVGNDVLGSVDGQHNVGKDAEADEAVDLGTDLSIDVDVVLASLGTVGDTVEVAPSEAELAGEAVDDLEEAEREVGLDIGRDGSKAEDVGVEGNDGVDEALEVETVQTGADVLEVGADVGVEVDLDLGSNLELNVGRGTEGDGVEAGLAVLVVRVVLDDLGRGGSTEGAELDIDGSEDADVGLGPGTGQDVTNTDVGNEVEGLAGGTSARLGPGAVAHGLGALVARVLLASQVQVDIGVDIDLCVGDGGNLDISIDVDVGPEANEAVGRGNGGEAGDRSNETHVDGINY